MLKLVKPTKIRMFVDIALVAAVLLVAVVTSGVFESDTVEVYGPDSLPPPSYYPYGIDIEDIDAWRGCLPPPDGGTSPY